MSVFRLSPNMTRCSRRYCPRTYTACIVACILLILLLRYCSKGPWIGGFSHDDDLLNAPQIEFPARSEFARILGERVDADNTILLTMVDIADSSMVINFYASSLKKHGIHNFLFISMDKFSCGILGAAYSELKQACFLFEDLERRTTPVPLSMDRQEKVYLKRFFILEALKFQYNVVYTEADMVFFSNPLPEIKKACGKCDLAIMWDSNLEHYDPDFTFSRSTDKTITLYNRLASYELSHGAGQTALNAALKEYKNKYAALKIVPLSQKHFRMGNTFFEKNACPGHRPYMGAVVIHNNYIQETANKVLRLKECQLWDWDGFDQYFTNTSRRYITVQTSGSRGHPEHQTLLNLFALGRILGRTVILPKLACQVKHGCNLLMRMYDHTHIMFIKRFNSVTAMNYRETSFLRNPRVPTTTKDSLSTVFHIAFRDDAVRFPSQVEPVKHLVPKDLDKGPTVAEIHDWVSARSEKVLRFDSLVGWFSHVDYHGILGQQFMTIIRQL